MIYVITDNQFLFAGIELILRKYEITVYQLSADDLRSHKVRKDHVFFIECPLREENLHSLRNLYQYGARVCYLMRSSIECDRKNASQFIDITTEMNVFIAKVLKTINNSACPPAVNIVRLTNQEFTVARLVLCGHSDVDIASELLITKRSSQDHINRVLKKLGGKSVADIYLQRNVIYGSGTTLQKQKSR